MITTKLIENVATHSRLYRLANQAINADAKEGLKRQSPQRRSKRNTNPQTLNHRRNKSDTDLSWYLGASSVQKNVANSKFYTENQIDESILNDPEAKLLKAFFDISDAYQKECLDEVALESKQSFFLLNSY